MKKIFFVLILFLLMIAQIRLTSVIKAQESRGSEITLENLSQSDQIIYRERLEAEIEDQHAQLLSQLNTYQNDERNFRVAHDQYTRLQTLNSIEGVVNSAKSLIKSRNTALYSYLNLLRLKIVEAEGIEMFHKERVIERILSVQFQIDEHSSKVDSVVSREEINELAEEFSSISELITETSYYALSVLSVGKLQAVYDQSVVINQRIIEEEGDTALIESTTRARSLAEIEKLISDLPPLFQDIWSEINLAEERTQGYGYLYRGLSRKLNTIYSKLSRLTAYFEEVENVK